MKSDLQIAREARLEPIEHVANRASIPESYLEHYGRDVAKVSLDLSLIHISEPTRPY